MIEYCRVGTRICDSLCDALSGQQSGVAEWQESLDFFQYRLNQWQEKRIPKDLQFVYGDTSVRRIRHLRTVLYLRANQLRLLMMRPVLCCSNPHIVADEQSWTTAVNIACDTTQILVDLNTTTDIYQLQQTQYNYFLVTALGVLLVVLARESRPSPSKVLMNAHIEQSTLTKARESLLAALNLLQSLAGFSSASRRQSLRTSSLCFRLGLLPAVPSDDPISVSDDLVLGFQFQDPVGGNVDFQDLTLPELDPGSLWVDLDQTWPAAERGF